MKSGSFGGTLDEEWFISGAAEHGGNQQRPMVRVNDVPRKLDHSEKHSMKNGS